jgi:hypothetical protein
MTCSRTVQPKLQMSASLSQDPVITASGARKGSGHCILGEGSPEREAEPKSMSFTLQLLDSPGYMGIVDGSTRYCGEWLPRAVPQTSTVTGESIDRSMSPAEFFRMVSSTSTVLPGCRSIAYSISTSDDQKSRIEQTTMNNTHTMHIRDRVDNLSANRLRNVSRKSVGRVRFRQ